MKIKKILTLSVLAVALLGCGKREPRHLVIMPDVSGSIDRESLEQAFKAIDELAGHLQRGDRLTIIPILGDAEAEASGKILRFEVPANRQAYDTDLRGFRSKLNASLKEMQANAIAHPGSKSDILGTVVLASQEFQTNSDRSRQLLAILSDFIQEDGELNFKTDKRVASRTAAKEFAAQVAKTSDLDFKGTAICLGLLRSSEYAHMKQSHRHGVQEFWLQYFQLIGAKPRLLTDGLGLLEITR